MTIALTPTQNDIQTALRAFLIAILPRGAGNAPFVVVNGQANRVAEPKASDFVVFWTISRRRIETNTDTFSDVEFTASIAGTVMNVTAVERGDIVVGSVLFGTGVTDGTVITALGTGTGGVGTYVVSPAQTVSQETISAGSSAALQPVEVTFQMDVHGPNSADNAQRITTLMRDAFAVDFFEALPIDAAPLHADDPRQSPFQNDQGQYEQRWIVDAMIQANQKVTGLPQEFASVVEIESISVTADFPP